MRRPAALRLCIPEIGGGQLVPLLDLGSAWHPILSEANLSHDVIAFGPRRPRPQSEG